MEFTGWLDAEQLAGWYRRAAVLVVPNWYEPFDMVVLEGMLHGVAIAAADLGGPAEILTHDVTGLLFRPRDVVAFTEALVQLVTSPSLRHRLGQAGHHEVRQSWTWPRILDHLCCVYQEIALAAGPG